VNKIICLVACAETCSEGFTDVARKRKDNRSLKPLTANKWLGLEADLLPVCSAEVRRPGVMPPSPILLHGVVLN
jgi:hypothetical protein